MSDDLAFDWVMLAPLEEVSQLVEQVCKSQELLIQWVSSTPDGIPMLGGFVTVPTGTAAASATLQGFWPDQTHMRLLPPEETTDAFTALNFLAGALYGAFQSSGWMPMEERLCDYPPRLLRPCGFRPRPSITANL